MATSNHRTTWLTFELEFLVENWDGTRETTKVIAELLGRSADACQQRYYQFTWGDDHAAQNKAVIDGTHAVAAYRSAPIRELGPTCSSCHVELPRTGICDAC